MSSGWSQSLAERDLGPEHLKRQCLKLEYKPKVGTKARFAYCTIRKSFQFRCEGCGQA